MYVYSVTNSQRANLYNEDHCKGHSNVAVWGKISFHSETFMQPVIHCVGKMQVFLVLHQVALVITGGRPNG